MGEQRHTVSLQPSGRTFEVEPGEAILVSALRERISLPYGCRMGTCRTYRGKVVAGSGDHADS
nr:2Fe-2S iron-sulfur cluster binding domain-containing protein [Anaerolineae bacterium]